MSARSIHTVTGAFGNLGGYIAAGLLKRGLAVETLTNSPGRQSPLHGRVRAHALDFAHPQELVRSLARTKVLYNTYWVRFNADDFSYKGAVENSRILFAAAKKAGVKRVVQVSISNPSLDSPFEYFRGKAQLEQALVQSGLPHSILRPALLFGPEDILINNIAWMLRRFPVYGLFGDGSYRLQPIFVEDMAALAVREGRARGNRIVQAIGPEDYSFKELVLMLGRAIGHPRPVVPMPAALGWAFGKLLGLVMHDRIITWEEVRALMADCLHVDAPPAGRTPLSRWAAAHSATLGLHYASELRRRRDRQRPYGYARLSGALR